jgi:DNA-directed RNA polymerase omega subunit
MSSLSIEDFNTRCESLYQLVIAAAKRSSALARPETRPLVQCDSKKPTVVALHEILEGKVKVVRSSDADEEYVE